MPSKRGLIDRLPRIVMRERRIVYEPRFLVSGDVEYAIILRLTEHRFLVINSFAIPLRCLRV